MGLCPEQKEMFIEGGFSLNARILNRYFSVLISCLVTVKFLRNISYFSAVLNDYIIWPLRNDNSFSNDESADFYNGLLRQKIKTLQDVY